MLCREIFKDKKKASGQKRICVLGSTGSIGESTLRIIRDNPESFSVHSLVAGSNFGKLAAQIQEFSPSFAAINDPSALPPGKEQFDSCKVQLGSDAICELASHPDVDLVVAAIVGVAGLKPVLAALRASKTVALANKESLVCGGALVQESLEKYHGKIIPVDSEHSSLFQCLEGHSREEIRQLILTASGGPFLNTPIEKFQSITPSEAVKHPRWNMGPKISVDSASMMNKALEVIEAWWLFGIKEIDVLVHPQSIVHSLISLLDGTLLAHLSNPDMRAPIAYAMLYPDLRLDNVIDPLQLAQCGGLDFLPLDKKKFPGVELAQECLLEGGAMPAVLNIANEIAVDAFLKGIISFPDIMSVNYRIVSKFKGLQYGSFGDIEVLYNEISKRSGEFL